MKKDIKFAAIVCLSMASVAGVAQTVETDEYIFHFRETFVTKSTFDDQFREVDYWGKELLGYLYT